MTDKTERILDNLKDRGFDNWWDNIDQETKEDIINDIDNIIND